jgi:mRNA-degrading endonuclease toxin of MazEF toxin-antitoxin module
MEGYPTEVDINQKANLPQPSYVQLDNIQTISKQRFAKFLGTIDTDLMNQVSEKVVLALQLENAFASKVSKPE